MFTKTNVNKGGGVWETVKEWKGTNKAQFCRTFTWLELKQPCCLA